MITANEAKLLSNNARKELDKHLTRINEDITDAANSGDYGIIYPRQDAIQKRLYHSLENRGFSVKPCNEENISIIWGPE